MMRIVEPCEPAGLELQLLLPGADDGEDAQSPRLSMLVQVPPPALTASLPPKLLLTLCSSSIRNRL